MSEIEIRDDWIDTFLVVYFLDHTENEPEPATIRVIGRLVAIESKYIRLRAWECVPEHDPASMTEWCIVRSTIKRIDPLVPQIGALA